MLSRLELLSLNTVAAFALQTALVFVDGEVKQMLFAGVLTFAGIQNYMRGCEFLFGPKAELLMDPQQLQVSNNLYQSNQRVIY